MVWPCEMVGVWDQSIIKTIQWYVQWKRLIIPYAIYFVLYHITHAPHAWVDPLSVSQASFQITVLHNTTIYHSTFKFQLAKGHSPLYAHVLYYNSMQTFTVTFIQTLAI